MAGLGPAIHVFGAEIVPASRRGCPGRAQARGFGKRNAMQKAIVRSEISNLILKIATIACCHASMIRFVFEFGIRLATFVASAAAFFGARNRPSGSVVAIPCQFPAGPPGRGNVLPARRAADLAQAIDYTRIYPQNQADFGAETKILPDFREPRSLRRARGCHRPGGGRPSSPPRGRGQWDSVAVVGSIMRRTSVTLFAGKPLRRACS